MGSKFLQQKYLLFSLLFLAALFLRLFSLESNGLWIDEIWSIQTSSQHNTVSEIIALCLNDTHPPFFDILLHYLMVLTNDAEFTGRYLALFFGMLGILLTHYYALKIVKNEKLALFAMAIVSFNYFHLTYSFEGRFYTLIFLFSLIAIGELYLFIISQQKNHLVKFWLFNVLFLYTHYYGGILLIVLAIIVLALVIFKQISRRNFWQIAFACFMVFVCFLPWFPQMIAKEGMTSWMSKPSFGDFFNYFYLYSGKNPIEFAFLFLPLVLAFKQFKVNKILFAFLYGTIFLGFFIPFVISQFSTPLLHNRYTFIYLPSIFLLAAIFWFETKIISTRMKQIAYGITLFAIVGNLFFIRDNFYSGNKDQWKEISLFLKSQEQLPVITEHERYLNYYLAKNDLDLAKNIAFVNSEIKTPFWFVAAPYDQRLLMSEGFLETLNTKEYPGGFTLYKVKKK